LALWSQPTEIVNFLTIFYIRKMFTLKLSKHLFWDISPNVLDEVKSKRIIIERVFTLGDIEDIKEIVRFYGLPVIKKEIVNAGFIDNKSLEWISLFLKIPKNKFRCYLKQLSNPTHWNS